MKMEIDIVTLFPGFFEGPLQESILNRAQQKGLVKIRVHNLRDYAHDRHKTADDKPFGGGAGMVMKPEPIFECVEKIHKRGWVVLLDPQGEPFHQNMAKTFSKKKHLVFIAGHYEGVDNRVKEHLVDQEVSVGDFITMGGEAPMVCVLEALIRLIPGVLGNAKSLDQESFQSDNLEYPQYTRPQKFRDWCVPGVLVSGNHKEVEKWRKSEAKQATQLKRADLLSRSRGNRNKKV